MIKVFLVLCVMLFLHVFEDFHLQGILASMKQKEWWVKQNGYSDMYKNDYRIALLIHSFEWAFLISLPICIRLYYTNTIELFILYILNLIAETTVHYMVDNLKANMNVINLVTDQFVHLSQIVVTWFLYIVAVIASI